ncbi:Protein STU1 [Colletotrichum trifolii]|uniref:Protein STU1 n=1 Tax=Colletotrichum trifolii TaxID=5466 RepID=A0A4R8R6B7_COLTR|nr:Protein STU1 [Colletotrichum trifolii]
MAEKITEEQVEGLLKILRTDASIDAKVQHVTGIKSGIKQHNVPDLLIPQVFDGLRTASVSQHAVLVNAGFTALNHLLTRLSRQEPKYISKEAKHTLPLVVDKLGDPKEKFRSLAAQALTTMYAAAPLEVERSVRNVAMVGKNPRAKEASMHWLLYMHDEQGMQFRAYVPTLMELLEDADGMVRDVAKATVIGLFRSAPNAAKSDLKRQLKNFKVRPAIEQAIVKELAPSADHPETPHEPAAPAAAPRPKLAASTTSMSSERPVTPALEARSEVEPAYVNTQRELDDIFKEMMTYFEGRETEQNWLKREESMTKLRKLIAGNVPQDYPDAFMLGLKGLLDGIIKAINSLRTSLSKEGCILVQDIAITFGPGMDPLVELLMQTFIKLSAATKKLSSQLANATIDTIIGRVTYNSRIMQHVSMACQDKNVQPRTYAAGWLKTILNKEAHHKSHIEHGGGLEMVEKSIKRGLADANPGVRERMRSTYWIYAKMWPARAEALKDALDTNAQKLLDKDPNNPNAPKRIETERARPGLGLSKSTMASSKPSLRETMMAQKKATMASRNLPPRPGSAMANLSPVRPQQPAPSAPAAGQVHPVKSTVSGGMSVRPMRPTKKRPEMAARPATAGPYSVRTHDGPSNEAPSPESLRSKNVTPKKVEPSPRRTVTRTRPGHTSHASESSVASPSAKPAFSKSVSSPRASPRTSPAKTKRSQTTMPFSSPTQDNEDLTLLVPNLASLKASPPKAALEVPLPATPRQSTDSPVAVAPSVEIPLPTEPAPEPTPEPEARPSRQTSLEPPAEIIPQAVASPPVQAPAEVQPEPEPEPEHDPEPASAEPATEVTPALPTPAKEDELQSGTAPANGLKVFEDPFVEEQQPSTPSITGPVLEDKPINEVSAPALNGHADLNGAPETPDKARQTSRLLDSGVTRVKAKSLDVHGFRKLQSIIRDNKAVFTDEKFEALLRGLFEYLEAPLANLAPEKVQDVKAQILATIKLLLKKERDNFQPHVSRGLESLVATRSAYDSRVRIVSGLELLAEELVGLGDPPEIIVVMTKLLRGKEDTSVEGSRCLATGLHVLKELLDKRTGFMPSGGELAQLAALAGRCLESSDSGVRMGAVQLCVALHSRIGDGPFWELIKGAKNDPKNLITYYIAKKQREGSVAA